jgi:hypothetical protein
VKAHKYKEGWFVIERCLLLLSLVVELSISVF